ncbi:hypothetical protein [Arthrobacter sp. ISL-72]|uniref:hypothetical protein n=1 Tax=Arthrobacter sp. ISL-72 TaxID=2819114 RepID=UPI001BEC2F6B|nr:hypothetical protein [Arthrobacter sp. ISL-72]MBT2597396.1 hypothetical protein [Arthrobacter sp. ISL-72]
MSQLVILAELSGLADGDVAAPLGQPQAPPFHCGEAMEWTTPVPGPTELAYSYDGAEAPAELPAVWRCSCGFQLDSQVHLSPVHLAAIA